MVVARLWCFLCLLTLPLDAQGFRVTEFMAANASTLADENAEFSDWIEIYNSNPSTTSLAGWSLTDDLADLRKWTFPNLSAPPNSYLMVFASGKNRTNAIDKLHTNFKLNKGGGFLALVDPAGKMSTAFNAYPPQLTDVSYGTSIRKESESLIGSASSLRLLVPDKTLPSSWRDNDYDDSTWPVMLNGVGYDRLPAGASDPLEPPAPVTDLSTPADVIVATSSNSPGNEGVGNAIDNSTATKYLNFDKLNAGFTITLGRGSSVISGLKLTSANDAPERDPTSFILSGSQEGKSFTEVARGSIPAFPARFSSVQVTFVNTVAYKQYRLIFPTVQNAATANSMQISEVEFLGQTTAVAPRLSPYIQTNIESLVYGTRSSVFLRFPFQVGANSSWDDLNLLMRYDDGFAAWLNGTWVARGNNPSTLGFQDLASTNRFRSDASQQTPFDLKPFMSLLRPGTNLLAVQVWNDRLDSVELLLQAQLTASRNINQAQAYLDQPTPGAANSEGSEGVVDEPVLNTNHGFFDQPFDLIATCSTPEAAIRYTTDGSIPSGSNGVAYTGPIRLDRTTVLRVAGVREGWRASKPVTRTFIFVRDVQRQDRTSVLAAGFPLSWNGQAADYGFDARIAGPNDSYSGKYARTFTNDLRTLPSMSIVMDNEDMFGPGGIYSNPLNHGAAWERAGSIELIYPDGHGGFQSDAGFRVQGGAFRGFNLTLKKSFRVIFRSKYGDSTLNYPLFGKDAAQQINNFVLRANSNDAWPYSGGNAVYARDAFAMESVRAMGKVSSHSTFVHLYINGLYWGLYNPAERPDAAFSATYYGGAKADWDAINQDSVPDGNNAAWNRMLGMLGQDFTREDVYQRIQGNNPDGTRNPAYEHLIDVEDLIDYMIMNFYIGNGDWPGRNWWASRNRNNGDGFKFHPWDSETALGLTGVDVNVTGVSGAVAAPYAALRKNPSFRLRFADHVYTHFSTGGVFYVNPAASAWNPAAPQNNRPAARFFELSEGISRAIVGESARWGDQLHSGAPYTRDENWQSARTSLLTSYFPRRSAIVLDQFRGAGLYPKTEPPAMNTRGGAVPAGFQLTLTAAQGSIYYTTNGSDPRFITSAILYKGPVALAVTTKIKTRVLNGAEWSALNEAQFLVGGKGLEISEIQYHPAQPSAAEAAAGFTDEADFEFLELHNQGSLLVDLSDLTFVSGIEFSFTNSTLKQLAPGAYLVLVRNRAAFEKRYGQNLPIAGDYQGKLDNSGERIQAVNSRQELILNVRYDVVAPWPSSPDGRGPSLELQEGTDPDTVENWHESRPENGTPAKLNSQPKFFLEILGAEGGELWATFAGKKGMGYTIYISNKIPSASWQVFKKGDPLPEAERVNLLLGPLNAAQTRYFQLSIP